MMIITNTIPRNSKTVRTISLKFWISTRLANLSEGCAREDLWISFSFSFVRTLNSNVSFQFYWYIKDDDNKKSDTLWLENGSYDFSEISGIDSSREFIGGMCEDFSDFVLVFLEITYQWMRFLLINSILLINNTRYHRNQLKNDSYHFSNISDIDSSSEFIGQVCEDSPNFVLVFFKMTFQSNDNVHISYNSNPHIFFAFYILTPITR